jgi:hypothetical protein
MTLNQPERYGRNPIAGVAPVNAPRPWRALVPGRSNGGLLVGKTSRQLDGGTRQTESCGRACPLTVGVVEQLDNERYT